MAAEQLAPYLATTPPPQADGSSAEGSTLVREGWVTEALVRLGGEPVVTPEGDIIYVFPELMATGGPAAPIAALPRTASLARGGALALADASAGAAYGALAYPEAPPAWRPRVGESVVVGGVGEQRCGPCSVDMQLSIYRSVDRSIYIM